MTHQEKVELLVRLDERTDRLMKWTDSHKKFHRSMGFALISAAVTIVVAQGGMIFALLRIMSSS